MLSIRGVYEKGRIKPKEKILINLKKEIPVIITFLEDQEYTGTGRKKYQFSDLSGKLEWQGDATAEQRAMRDEW